MRFETAILTDQESIATLIPEWDELSRRDPHSTPYQTGSLTIGLGDLSSSRGTPYIVVARSDAGVLVGVLPLHRVRGGGRLGGQRLEGYTTWHTSYFDCSVDPAVPEAGQALLDAVRANRDWDRCDLRFLRPEANLLRGCAGARDGSDGSFQTIRREAFVERNGGGGVTPHKAARRLSKAGEVLFTAAEPLDQIGATIQRFAAIHTNRWAASGKAAEFADPSVSDQLARLLGVAAGSGLCRIGTLRLSGEIVAVHIAFRWRGVQFSWRMAHDAQWQETSPGRLLMSLMIEEAFESGCQEYDLGRGNDEYKQRWPTEARPLSRLILPGRTWRGRIATFRSRY